MYSIHIPEAAEALKSSITGFWVFIGKYGHRKRTTVPLLRTQTHTMCTQMHSNTQILKYTL
jgi:hypothetical protein